MAIGDWAAHLPAAPGRPASERPLTELLDTETPLPAALLRRWAADPGRPALLEDGGSSVTAGQLEAWTRSVAGRLQRLGATPGDRIAWVPATDLASAVLVLAALRAGVVPAALGPRSSAAEMAHVLADCRPVLVVAAPGEPAATARSAAASVPGAPTVLGTDEVVGPPPGGSAPGRATEQGPEGLDRAGPEDPALVVYTSGTTGQPKGAVIGHRALSAGTASLALAWRIEPEDRLVLALPLFHVHGLVAGLLATLAAGGSVLLQPRFDPAAALDAAGREDATLFYGVPTMYHRLAIHPDVRALGRLRLCVCGSAPLEADLWHRLATEAGVGLLERYGMTETLLTVSNPYAGERRPGTVGLALPGVSVRLAEPLADDGTGELVVRGPTLFQGYWERPSATAAAFVDGWFVTGDMAAVDDAGYLVIRGRSGDMIICGGHNVYPAEVEDALAAHPGVREVAVRGVPSEEWGEEVAAWVVADGVAETDLAVLAAERLAPFKRPRRYRFVEELPRNAMGKVQRRALS